MYVFFFFVRIISRQIHIWSMEAKRHLFIQTKAFKEVEKNAITKSPVIVTGHSGPGKSAIIQHITLKYWKRGWRVKPIKVVEDIVNAFSSKETYEPMLFVLNDPIGKGSFNELAFNTWIKYEEVLSNCFQKAKVLISCKRYILFDCRLKGLLKEMSAIVDVNDEHTKLSLEEKRQIFERYKVGFNFTKEILLKWLQWKRIFFYYASYIQAKKMS